MRPRVILDCLWDRFPRSHCRLLRFLPRPVLLWAVASAGWPGPGQPGAPSTALPVRAGVRGSAGAVQSGHPPAGPETTDSIPRDSLPSPCQDFYQYVTQDDPAEGRPPVRPARLHLPWELTEVLHRDAAILPALLETARREAATTPDTATRLVGDFYGSCLADTTGTAEGTLGDTARATYCRTQTQHQLGEMLGEVYVKHVASPAVKAQATALLAQLKQALARRVRAEPWLTARSKQRVLDALATLPFEMGWPDQWPSHAGLVLSPTDFKGNLAAVPRAEGGGRLARTYDVFATSSSATAGLLRPPLFDPAGDTAWNIGALGAVLGHELTHDVDRPGGREGRWQWTPAESTAFYQRRQQVVARYAVIDQRTGGDGGEHVADINGLILAHDVLIAALGNSTVLRGGLTPEQRFFLGFAVGLAYIHRSAPAVTIIGKDSEEMAHWRVNLAVANLPSFAPAFGCKAGDAMVLPPGHYTTLY